MIILPPNKALQDENNAQKTMIFEICQFTTFWPFCDSNEPFYDRGFSA